MSAATTHYVCGFLFNPARNLVALIEKRKGPASVIGRLNGVGGKIEPEDESPAQAMAREFREETGVRIAAFEWVHFATLVGPAWSVAFFRAFDERVWDVRTVEAEPVDVHPVAGVVTRRLNVVGNLPVLLALALDDSGIVTPVRLVDAA